ncbi:MAG: ABC transporter permease [Cytophagales bacterium]
MTILGPVFFAILMIVPVWVANLNPSGDKRIAVVDDNIEIVLHLPESESTAFLYLHTGLDAAKKLVKDGQYDGLLHIPVQDIDQPTPITFFGEGNMSLDLQRSLEWKLNSEFEKLKIERSGIDPKILEEIKTNIVVNTINLTDEGGEEQKNNAASAAAGLGGAVLIYLFIFMYGIQVMRGVIEEKTNRIVEVIITSVKPVELMAGKISGIACVALTQFLLWIVLTFALSSFISSRFQVNRFADANLTETLAKTKTADLDQALEVNKVISAVQSLNIPYLLMVFAFYFLGGYLLYASLFAAIGSAVDNETDTQQFMLPVTIPLVLAFIFAQTIIRSPDAPLAVWLSIIPFTSPIIMMVRIPFGVVWYQLALSMVSLVLTIVLFSWLAGRIYRVGILMYGKKPSFREIGKWMFY